MSVVGRSVADTSPVEIYQPVGIVAGAGSLGTEENPIFTSGGGDTAGIGSPNDAAWTGTGPGTVIAILKGIYMIQQAIDTDTNEIVQDMSVVRLLLEDVKTNTTPNG